MIVLVRLMSYISAIAWLTGFVLQTLRWYDLSKYPLYIGSTVFTFVSLPLLYYINKTHFLSKKEHIQWLAGILGVSLFVVSTWMKANYIQGAPVVLIQSYLVLTFLFLPYLFYNHYQKSMQRL